MSSVPSPRVRKPKPFVRLNHLTSARSKTRRRNNSHVGALLLLFGGMHGSGIVERNDVESLKPAVAVFGKAFYARALKRDLMPVAAKTRHMQQNIRLPAAVRHDETIALGHVKPLDCAGNLKNAAGITRIWALPSLFRRFFSHDCPLIITG